MKLMTVFGTRPEIIRLSQVIRVLDQACEQTLVHTGQNFDPRLSEIFFEELGVRAPDVHLGVHASGFAEQAGEIIARMGGVLQTTRPDRVLVLGDTNSGLSAIVAARMGIPVYHMEAGNRCYDNRVPEEINRRLIDHTSDVLLPYTYRSKENLIREGIERHRIFVTGNPIREVIEKYKDQIQRSQILASLDVRADGYGLATIHRSENVDAGARLLNIMRGLEHVAQRFDLPVIVSLHPRTADRLARSGISIDPAKVRLIPPQGFFDFVRLEQHARVVLTDSGTVQEECCIFGVPNVTVRDVTERPETIECGSNILSGVQAESIVAAVQQALSGPGGWQVPEEYMRLDVARTVSNIVCMSRAVDCA